MLTDEQLADALDLIDSRYQKVVTKYLQKVGETILKIGKLNQSSINRLIQLRRMGVDVKTIERELQKATNLTKKDIKDLYQRAAEEANTDARFDYVTKGVEPDGIRWEALVESIWRQTAGAMENLSKSTAVAEGYREAIDEAVQAVSMGVTDYNSTIRDTVKKLGSAGLQVKYQSGAKKRLDSAVRMNILDGVRQVQQQAQELIGEEIGADGVQLTAHPMSAPDHEPVQGRIFDKDNFQLMQSGRPFQDVDGNEYDSFSRPITQWHCRHLVYYILLGITKPLYSKEQLQQWKDDNRRGVTIGGQHYTRYQVTQLMRKLELQMRRQKDTAILAKACGDDTLRRECQSNITKLTTQYKAVAEAAGLKTRFEKTYVHGFEPVSNENNSVTGSKMTPAKTDPLHKITNLDKEKYKNVSTDIATEEVIITDERIEHIKERHPNDYERFNGYLAEIIQNPDYILEDSRPATAMVLKEIKQSGERFRLALRLATSTDKKGYKNSVITFLKIKDKEWRRLIKNKKILYKAE